MNKKPEILAPAGSMESLRYALMYGADAVYLAGKSFGMRAGADNFDINELAQAVCLAHKKGVKVYLACNTVARDHELPSLSRFVAQAADIGVDAIIVSDLGVFSAVQRTAPGMDIHISTQMGVANSETAGMLHAMGAVRVVLARELSFDEICSIRAKTPDSLELEAFVHGSMCVSFSGRCLISNYLTGRDANRGACAQPCRWKYSLVEETRPGEYYPVLEDDNGAHILNSKDMCMIDHIPRLISSGITSFKIEGRAKSSYYAAVITNAYRCAVDDYLTFTANGGKGDDFILSEWIRQEVNKVSHREYSTGFYLGGEPGQVYGNGGYVRDYEVAAVVKSCDNGLLTASQRNKFCVGDTLEAMQPKTEPVELFVSSLTDENGESIDSTPHPNMIFSLPYSGVPLPEGALLRRKR